MAVKYLQSWEALPCLIVHQGVEDAFVKMQTYLFEPDANAFLFLTYPDAEANAVCEIVHVKSESEGRPERVFHLCCR